MKNLTDILREADPLRHEAHRNAQERRVSRRVIVDSLRNEEPVRQPRFAAVAAVAVIFISIVAGALHWSRGDAVVAATVGFEIRLAEITPSPELTEVTIRQTDEKIYLHHEIVVTNSDIGEADVTQGDTASTFNIDITFNAAGSEKIFRATRNHVGRPLAILLDGEVAMAPVLRSPISRSATITGSYTRAQAERIVAGILVR